MEELCYPILDENDVKQRSIFTLNDSIQVVFITNLKTGKKLDDDYNVNEYLNAVVQANLLHLQGVSDPKQIVTIAREGEIDDNKVTVVIALDVVTNAQDGVDELRCSITEDGLYSETEEPSTSDDSSPWNQQVTEMLESESSESSGVLPDVAQGPTLRWSPEMTTQLINVRGNMDSEFAKAKYKFRLWEQVALKLNEILLNVKVTAKDCDDKWRNIVATYRKNIDKIKCCGDPNVRWEYFYAMDNILKGTRELQADEAYENLVTDEAMTSLLCSLDSVEMDVMGQPIDIISISSGCSPEPEMESDLDESLQDCIITRKLNGEQRKWNTRQCLLLLHLRNQMEDKFAKSQDRVPHLWREIASQMNINFLSDFSASELECVWNHCNISYEINLEKLKSKGVNTIDWKYFAVMDELRGGTNEISDLCVPRPGESLLSDFHELSQKHSSLWPRIDLPEVVPRDETDSEDTATSLTGIFWTHDMVRVLISLKKVIEQEIVKHKIPRKKQWGILVRRFRALKNITLTEESCEEKWRNLVRTYKKNLMRVREKGTRVIRWPYFWRMHEILGNPATEIEKLVPYSNSNKTKLVESVDIPSNVISTVPLSERFVIGSRDETESSSPSDVLSSLHSSYQQNQVLHEIIDEQSKKIEELHREQLNIKALLTQLLQKFP